MMSRMADEAAQQLATAVDRHLPVEAIRHIDRCTVIASRSAAGNPMLVVESYDRDFDPVKVNIGTDDGMSVVLRVQYEDGRWHNETWVDREGEITRGHHHQPVLWAAGFSSDPAD